MQLLRYSAALVRPLLLIIFFWVFFACCLSGMMCYEWLLGHYYAVAMMLWMVIRALLCNC